MIDAEIEYEYDANFRHIQLRCKLFASLLSFSAMLSINLAISFQYSSKLSFSLNIVTYFLLSKQKGYFTTNIFLEFPYEAKSLSASLQHRRPTSYLHKEILRRKKSNFGRRIFIFVLQIRNTSPLSGKIITYLKIERMSLNSLSIWLKHKIEMQIIYDGKKVQVWEFVFQGLNIGKWSTGKHCDGMLL